MTDIIVILVILLILFWASAYIYKAKKSGKKCIGCPESGCCNKKNCGCDTKNTK